MRDNTKQNHLSKIAQINVLLAPIPLNRFSLLIADNQLFKRF
jgi:hypothetical protein